MKSADLQFMIHELEETVAEAHFSFSLLKKLQKIDRLTSQGDSEKCYSSPYFSLASGHDSVSTPEG
jgi:hypothetical protein